MQCHIAFLVFPGCQSLDVSGPLDVFAEANRRLPAADHYIIDVIGTHSGPIACSNGLLIQAHKHFSEAPDAYDLLLAAGGPNLPNEDFGEALNQWLQKTSNTARRFGSICNGAFLLARASLLKGKTVTTHWNDATLLAQQFPATKVEPDRLFIQDGRLYTSAGVTAGIDLALHLLSQDHGTDITLHVARRLVVFTQRTGGQSQFSPMLTPIVAETSPAALVRQFVLAHLQDKLTLTTLADVAHMSVRNFSRTFVKETHVTPAEFVESVRLDAARKALEESDAPLKTIAFACGFNSAQQLRDVFKRRLGVLPQQYRGNFRAQE